MNIIKKLYKKITIALVPVGLVLFVVAPHISPKPAVSTSIDATASVGKVNFDNESVPAVSYIISKARPGAQLSLRIIGGQSDGASLFDGVASKEDLASLRTKIMALQMSSADYAGSSITNSVLGMALQATERNQKTLLFYVGDALDDVRDQQATEALIKKIKGKNIHLFILYSHNANPLVGQAMLSTGAKVTVAQSPSDVRAAIDHAFDDVLVQRLRLLGTVLFVIGLIGNVFIAFQYGHRYIIAARERAAKETESAKVIALQKAQSAAKQEAERRKKAAMERQAEAERNEVLFRPATADLKLTARSNKTSDKTIYQHVSADGDPILIGGTSCTKNLDLMLQDDSAIFVSLQFINNDMITICNRSKNPIVAGQSKVLSQCSKNVSLPTEILLSPDSSVWVAIADESKVVSGLNGADEYSLF